MAIARIISLYDFPKIVLWGRGCVAVPPSMRVPFDAVVARSAPLVSATADPHSTYRKYRVCNRLVLNPCLIVGADRHDTFVEM